MSLNKSNLAKELESVLNQDIPTDLNEVKKIKNKNKRTAKGMSDAIDRFLKSASVDIKGIQMLPGTQVQTLPGQPVVNAPPIAGGAGVTSGPGQAVTSAPAKQIPPTGLQSGKVY
jgi:hypothetical protein